MGGGWTLSQESRNNIAEARIRMGPLPEATRKKISEARKGMVFTAEHRENLSKAHMGLRQSVGTRKKKSNAMMGHVVSDETRKLISEKNRGRTHAKDETGNTYGRLTVLSRSVIKHGAVHWLCQCSCGNKRIVSGRHLRSGNTQSCGCVQKERHANRLDPGVASFRKALATIKGNAYRRGYIFELTDEEAKTIMRKSCFYCGSEPVNICRSKTGNGDFKYNGLDRVDNTKGYIIGNVVPSCPTCNWAKGTMTQKQFIEHFKKVVDLWEKKKY